MVSVRSLVGGVTLFLLSLWLQVPAGAAQTVRVGVYQNSPKVALSDAGRAEGIFIDVIESVAAREGWTLEYVPGTWAEGLERLEQGRIDLMPDVARTAEREAQYGFHDEPVLASWNQVYTRKGSGVRTLLDLEGKHVAVLAGSVQERQLSQMAASFSLVLEWVPKPDFDAAFAAVQRGEADAVVTNRFFGVRNAARYGLEDTAIIFSPSKLFFATPKGPHAPLLAAIDQHLLELKKNSDSVYYRSLRRWSVDEVRTATPSRWPPPHAKCTNATRKSWSSTAPCGPRGHAAS
jgi:ABC-type amino acid transport substrate-binding protein